MYTHNIKKAILCSLKTSLKAFWHSVFKQHLSNTIQKGTHNDTQKNRQFLQWAASRDNKYCCRQAKRKDCQNGIYKFQRQLAAKIYDASNLTRTCGKEDPGSSPDEPFFVHFFPEEFSTEKCAKNRPQDVNFFEEDIAMVMCTWLCIFLYT
jgi:hypothetical protein